MKTNLKEKLLNNENTNVNEIRKDNYFDNQNRGTLNESIYRSIERDLKRVYLKLKVVISPYMNDNKINELKQWDLWGPFLMCLTLGLILSITTKKEPGMVFTTVFVIIWIGSLIITINTKLLGGNLSLLQCICLLGYCIFPIVICALFLRILLPFLPGFIKILLVKLCFFWSVKASVPFIAQNINEKKKLLAVYPVALFFLYLCYFVLG